MSARATEEIITRVKRRLAAEADVDPARLSALIREESAVLSDVDVLTIMRRLRDDTTGAGPLEQLLADPTVTDICVNGPHGVYVDRGSGLEATPVRFAADADVRHLASRLAAGCGRRLDDAHPFCDGHLTRDNGTLLRFHAVLRPTAHVGTCISLRVLRSTTATLDDLAARGAFDAERGAALRRIVRDRRAFLVLGGTGAGKTTLLSAMLAEVDATERIVVIEDTLELTPSHPHVLNLTSRGANAEGAGEITLSDLLRQSLRMRPDRIVVGEIRGAEVVDLLAALNTGHDGGAGTLHANSIHEVPARMEALAALGGLDRPSLHSQLAAAVEVILVVKRHPDGSRVLHQLGVLEGNPVRAKVLWDSVAGEADGYREVFGP
ncbi:TadA family conjugal transfer-associated ATPase [Corynebacterium sanguinis]|uniref:TadA family conjugal transfer-associated ATPase n=1 Tax=Corynebacterium sanguinis TaxID=2594913 RepID=UPI00119E49B0|nr:TadA family conjugal transfer-associated ATPase [Corynebacterium sanguinis]MCT2047811.1 TadA family conjugal transfer-associated ATPase [Corynebacterium sanguinis]MCT2252312.1 TadA family conjugal transfer-associated ATPase [Corynebacterium sanguinis]TVS21807.1 TadA family conjugal transfer-associated ATPase [Corynebacterium sanguinis]